MRRRRVALLQELDVDTSSAAARFDVDRVADRARLLDHLAGSGIDVVVVPAKPEGPELVRAIRQAAPGPIRVVAVVDRDALDTRELGALDADEHLFLPADATEVALRLGGETRVAPDPIREMVRTLPGVVYRCENDREWTMRLIGDEIEQITGYPAGSFIDNRVQSYASIIYPLDRPRVEHEVDDGLARDGDFGCEYRLVRADGELVWVLERGRLVEVAGGHVVLDGLLFEITERKRAQGQLRASMAEQAATQAVTEERVRIARDLHDSVGHALSVIALQAGAAETHLGGVPGPVTSAVKAIAQLTVETLEDMDRLLDLLHEAGDPGGKARGMSDLQGLIDRVRAAGMLVSFVGDERAGASVAPEVDAICFRLVQEGLTNALKHAPDAAITVELSTRADGIDVQVVNEPPLGRSPGTWGSGRGLSGLRERVEAIGGRFHAGERPAGGFAVRASLPSFRAPVPPHGAPPGGAGPP